MKEKMAVWAPCPPSLDKKAGCTKKLIGMAFEILIDAHVSDEI